MFCGTSVITSLNSSYICAFSLNLQQSALDDWELLDVNTSNLEDNCYFATAAGLCGLTTHDLVDKTETMQEYGGTIDATRQLIYDATLVHTIVLEFEIYEQLLHYFSRCLKLGSVERFGLAYLRPDSSESSINGHMIAIKVWKSISNELFVRSIDFQLNPNERFLIKVLNN